METTNPQNLKYGIIYLYSDRSLSPGMHDPETVVEKFVYPMQVKWIDEPGRENLLLIARRFNVGNIGRYATVSLTLNRMNRSGGWFEAIHRFADALMGVADDTDGDIVINEDDFGVDYIDQSSVFGIAREAAPQDNTRVENTRTRGRWARLRKHMQELAIEECVADRKSMDSAPDAVVEADPIQEEEGCEVENLEREREAALMHIKNEIVNYIARYHNDPKELMEELLSGKVVVGRPGRLLVNGDMRVVLPEYDEMEIKMPAMCRTLYILFLKLRQQGMGIVLRNIDDYRDEIKDIYGLVKPGANESRVELSISNLCDPLSDSLNQMISRVNRCIRNVIADKSQASQYTIGGSRGEAYSISLDPELIVLPRAIMA